MPGPGFWYPSAILSALTQLNRRARGCVRGCVYTTLRTIGADLLIRLLPAAVAYLPWACRNRPPKPKGRIARQPARSLQICSAVQWQKVAVASRPLPRWDCQTLSRFLMNFLKCHSLGQLILQPGHLHRQHHHCYQALLTLGLTQPSRSTWTGQVVRAFCFISARVLAEGCLSLYLCFSFSLSLTYTHIPSAIWISATQPFVYANNPSLHVSLGAHYHKLQRR